MSTLGKVSTIIPCYNQAHFLRDAIDSALAQHGVEVEVVVVNDGSSDSTKDVCDRYGDAIVAIHQQNGGLACARNAGIAASKGDYLQFLDADDRVLPGKFERQVSELRSRPLAGAAYSNGFIINRLGDRVEQAKVNHPDGDVFHSLLTMWGTLVPAVMVKRQALQTVGFFDNAPEIKGCEDVDLWLRIALRYQFVSLPELHFEYRQSSGQMSSNLEMMLTSGLNVIGRYATAHGNCELCKEASQEGIRRWKTVAAFGLMQQARSFAAEKQFYKAIRRVVAVARHHPSHLIQIVNPKYFYTKAKVVFRAIRPRRKNKCNIQS